MEDTDESVDIDGFNVSLYSDGTFSINKITSASGPDLVVPYTLTYDGKEYHCDNVYLGNLYGGGFNGSDDEIIPLITGDVYLSEGIKTLKGTFPLNRCKRLHIPKTVTEINSGSFNSGVAAGYRRTDDEANELNSKYYVNVTGFDLEEFVVDKDNEFYTANEGMLYTKDMKKLVSCPRGKVGDVVVPEGVETLGEAFAICNKLTGIKLSPTLKSIEIGSNPGFNYCLKLKSMTIPEGVEVLYGMSFRNCVSLESVTLPTTLKTFTSRCGTNDHPRYQGVFGNTYSLKELNWENTAIVFRAL